MIAFKPPKQWTDINNKIACIIAVTAFLGLIFILGSRASGDKKNFTEKDWAGKVANTKVENLYKPNKKDGVFFSPWMKMRDKHFFEVLGWKIFSNPDYSEKEETFRPAVLKDVQRRITLANGDFILWIGHNTFLVKVNGQYWLTDPIFSKRALLPPRVTPPAISLEEFNQSIKDVNIIISHNHYDHLDEHSIQNLPSAAKVYVPEGLGDFVKKMNKPHVVEMNWWQEHRIDNDTTLICLPAQHWSMRIGQKRNESLWAAFLLKTGDTTIFFGGDSGYFKGFKEIGRKYPDIDYAFMATTAYHPRYFMHYQHMNIPEAVKAFKDLKARFFIPTQWGTFHLGDEPVGFPALELKEYIKTQNLDPHKFKIMDIGEILPTQG
ncbi:MAG: hypothetical protein GY729_00215 [Desulfobacteraceae bacterium]|nr:hypothetical protein [Desulfobacteraceae bacterium]